MPHEVGLLATITTGLGLALILGYLAARLKMPPLVGYLLAGIIIGPYTPGFVGDINLLTQLAEIGVMLLMFGIGLHFSFDDLLSVKRLAIPGAIGQIIVATTMGAMLAKYWGWDWVPALVFGLCLSVASTVVLLKALEAQGLTFTVNGKIAVGWLIVEDLVMVLVLVLLPALAEIFSHSTEFSPIELAANLGFTAFKVILFIGLMFLMGKRIFPKILKMVEKTGSRELFTLCVIVAAIGIAFGAAKLFDVSFALGAFFSGMILRESEFSHRAASDMLPLKDAFAVLFFISVGMLFDPSIALNEPFKLLSVILIIMVGKTIAAIALVLMFGYSVKTALTVGASLAQIGEFSFILAGLSLSLGLLPPEGKSLIIAGALISIATNTLIFSAIKPLRRLLRV
jgi:monovalent cation:H+ antiporter-2, CPA2 family